MRKTKKALAWILHLLKNQKIKYRITGGFAANIYGSKRPLADIDIEIPEYDFSVILPFVKNYIVSGPKRYKDKNWQADLITLNYCEQEIDLFGAFNTKIFNKNTKKWISLDANFPKGQIKSYEGIKIIVIYKKDLILYKSKLKRRVNIRDVNNIS